MITKRLNTVLPFLLLLFTFEAHAQPAFQFTIQTWGTYTTYDHGHDSTTTQLGVGIRRARLRGRMTRDKATAFVQFDAATATMTDAQVDYALNDVLTLRVGRFVGPGCQAGGRTSHTTGFDFAERSIVGRLWAAGVGRDDYRTYGVALLGKSKLFNYEAMASNGSGTLNLKPYNSKSSNSTTDTGVLPQIDVMVTSQAIKPFDVGVHYGLPNSDRINVSALTAYAYLKPEAYIKGTFRGKVDFAHLTDYSQSPDVTLGGFQVSGFYKLFEKLEVGAGYASWDPNSSVADDAFGNILVGMTYFPDPENWKDSQFKLVFTFKTAEAAGGAPDPLIVHLVSHIYLH